MKESKMRYGIILFALLLLLSACGNSDKQGSSSVQNSDLSTPAISFRKKFLGSNTIELHWNIQPDALSYLLEYGTELEGFTNELYLDKAESSYSLYDLEFHTAYLFKLKTILPNDKEKESEVLHLKTGTQTTIDFRDEGPTN